MKSTKTEIQNRLKQEIEKIPAEHLPALLTIVHSFRESVALDSAEESFKKGWKESNNGDYQPIDPPPKFAQDLWK